MRSCPRISRNISEKVLSDILIPVCNHSKMRECYQNRVKHCTPQKQFSFVQANVHWRFVSLGKTMPLWKVPYLPRKLRGTKRCSTATKITFVFELAICVSIFTYMALIKNLNAVWKRSLTIEWRPFFEYSKKLSLAGVRVIPLSYQANNAESKAFWE